VLGWLGTLSPDWSWIGLAAPCHGDWLARAADSVVPAPCITLLGTTGIAAGFVTGLRGLAVLAAGMGAEPSGVTVGT